MNESSPVCKKLTVPFLLVQSSVSSHRKRLWIIFRVKSIMRQSFTGHSRFSIISQTEGTHRLRIQRKREFWLALAISRCSTWIIFSRYLRMSFFSFCAEIRTKWGGRWKTVPVKVVTNLFKVFQFTEPFHILPHQFSHPAHVYCPILQKRKVRHRDYATSQFLLAISKEVEPSLPAFRGLL